MSENSNIIIVVPEGKVKDYIDGTIRQDTPEEYVRQTVEKRLINEHKYAKEQVKIEYGEKETWSADITKIFNDKITEIAEKEKRREITSYPIFVTMIDHIGHDKRGGKIFRRDEKGNIIMRETEYLVKEKNIEGDLVIRKEANQEKVVNDHTIHVANIFAKWKKQQEIGW